MKKDDGCLPALATWGTLLVVGLVGCWAIVEAGLPWYATVPLCVAVLLSAVLLASVAGRVEWR